MLWPQAGLSGVSDEFVVVAQGFRVRLMGNVLELSFEASGTCAPGSARALAEKYIETLRKGLASPLALITEEEFLVRTTPPFGGMMTSPSWQEDRSRCATAVREARNALLSTDDQILRRSYDHLQDAAERLNTLDGEPAYEAYKAIEVLEVHFGSEAKAVDALGKTFKKAKRAANAPRHIPEKSRPPANAFGGSVELVKQVVRAYERYLLRRM